MIDVMYTKEMPVDKHDKPCGWVSESDLPSVGWKKLTRKGTLNTYDSGVKYFRVRDEKTGTLIEVPFDGVKLIEQEDEDV
jgi:hypothetical protein